MFSKSIFAILAFTSFQVQADVSQFMETPVLVQEVGLDGKPIAQFIDIFQKNPATGNFEPYSTYYTALRFFGACISEGHQTCSSAYILSEMFARSMAIANGRKTADPKYLPPIMPIKTDAKTQIKEVSANQLILAVTTKYHLAPSDSTSTFLIKKIPGISNIPHHFMPPAADEPQRKPISEVDDQLKSISTKVIMLKTDANTEDMVSGGGESQGTGFFLTEDGLLMTNHHVIDSFSECMKTYFCDVNFSQVLPNGKRNEFRTKVSLLTMSEAHDFALLKVKMPSHIQFSHFNFETQNIGPELVTLGYPADIDDGSEDRKTRLTYSFGNLVGFHNQTYSTSAYIYGGASGSPLLNAKTLKVVAILSNGAGATIPGSGSPGLARPIHIIDSEFQISDYLSGSKQARVKSQLKQVTEAKSLSEALPALNSFVLEKTFYGLPALKLLMVNHESKEIRKEIARTLQKMNVLAGSKI